MIATRAATFQDPADDDGSIRREGSTAKAIERVGDHAKNLAEQIIYIVKGTDVRHSSVGTVETMVR